MATKERRKTPPGASAYHRLTEGKRIIIETLRKEGLSNRHIADRVGCSPATVGRELKRNLGKSGCRHKKAQPKAKCRAAAKRREEAQVHGGDVGAGNNRNGVVRKALPKGRPFDDIAEEEMRRIDYMPDDRPLRCLNWRTLREAFAELLRWHMRTVA